MSVMLLKSQIALLDLRHIERQAFRQRRHLRVASSQVVEAPQIQLPLAVVPYTWTMSVY